MNRFNQSPLEALETSLQLEFEHFAQYDWSDDILKAKKRQLELIRKLYPITLTIQLAKRADKPVGVPKWFRSTMPSVKEMIEGVGG